MLPLKTWSMRTNTTLSMPTTDPPCRSGSPLLSAWSCPTTGKNAIHILSEEQDPTHHEFLQNVEHRAPISRIVVGRPSRPFLSPWRTRTRIECSGNWGSYRRVRSGIRLSHFARADVALDSHALRIGRTPSPR